MKQLELELKERLLIVGLPNNECELAGFKLADKVNYTIHYYNERMTKEDYPISFPLQRKAKLICKGSELTEEVAEGLVDIFDLSYYVDYDGHNPRSYKLTALESFKSAIEAHGYYWKKHPFGKLEGCCSGAGCGCMGMPVNVGSREEMDEILEAESKTFNPEKSIIFKMIHIQTK